ncbi:hypothetical protein K432DRAFT_439332 [Lepidopterella palustris CBS 459.81]|uniref:Uncharacterized protein n=1 Tax=Lepidopterella palustris CBS 459.81 TaxID=1314670 RepID=A0A8E2EKU8_9PEZI|nr:hypothetical protein K432DRAFT_439332 [Lepidopterella palustris CBS 459.81]
MTKANYRELKRETKNHRIFINSTKYNPLKPTNVPEDHKEKFDVIQELGRTLYSRYGYVPDNETPEKPWQRANMERATKLVFFAAKCRRENRNEAGWRSEVEFRLFERFDIEVACKRCRKRLWRSEIEASPSSSNSNTTSLRDRQQKRDPCKCNPTSRRDDYLDPGMSELFSSRIQELVCQPGVTDSQLGNLKKYPDRIHGLQRTRNFDKLLQEPYVHDNHRGYPRRSIEDVVKVSVNPDNGGDPLLFPFLVLEAKREKGPDSFEHMEMQTAFPIKNALQLQYDLLKTRGNTMDVPGGPLVWFLASRGEDWRVYAAFVHEEEGRPNYWINYLWSGSIIGHDEALQLILIIDYILDWARDIYRPNILRQLRILSAANLDDAMTFAFDPDVYSLQGEVQPWMEGLNIEPEEIVDPTISDTASVTFDEDHVDPLSRFRTPQGIVRDARFIDSRLRALYITRDNAQTLLRDFEKPDTAMQFARDVLETLSLRCIVLESDDVLSAVEGKWTGNVRPRTTLTGQISKIYAQFRVSYFMNSEWEQIRELTYLAVSDEAREILIECTKLRNPVRYFRSAPPECSKEEVIRAIDGFLQRSVRHDFVSALARRNFMINMENIPVITSDSSGCARELMSVKMTPKLDKDNEGPGFLMQKTVHRIYEKYSIGKREPSGPFLRISSRVDCKGRPLWRHWQAGDKLPYWESHLDKVLVYGDVLNAPYLPQGSKQKLCLYILDGQTEQLDPFYITAKLIWFLFTDCIYGTIREGKVYRTRENWQDNWTIYYFGMGEVQEHLNISRGALRRTIFDWIKMMNPSRSPEQTEMARMVKAWYVE